MKQNEQNKCYERKFVILEALYFFNLTAKPCKSLGPSYFQYPAFLMKTCQERSHKNALHALEQQVFAEQLQSLFSLSREQYFYH